jgi:Protein of unknown function (DUF1566)
MKVGNNSSSCWAVLILLFTVAKFASAQCSAEVPTAAKETQTRGYWIDTSGLMWAGKDNGKDMSWQKALKYCQTLRLAGYSDWRVPTLAELKGIYDRSASAPGLPGPYLCTAPFIWHVKGNLFLTGWTWSTTQKLDDRGRSTGFAWYFDFNRGPQNDYDLLRASGHLNVDANPFIGRFAEDGRRALCVRRSGE